jgi:hypothetical protein
MSEPINSKTKRINRQWSQTEIDLLEQYAGKLPINFIVDKFRQLAYKKRVQARTKAAIQEKMRLLGLEENCSGEYYCAHELSLLIGCSKPTMLRWLKNQNIAAILKPIKDGDKWRMHRDNVKAFCISYRAEISSYNVDLLWLLGLFDNR